MPTILVTPQRINVQPRVNELVWCQSNVGCQRFFLKTTWNNLCCIIYKNYHATKQYHCQNNNNKNRNYIFCKYIKLLITSKKETFLSENLWVNLWKLQEFILSIKSLDAEF